ncbi:glucosamine-6-phosphate deaminase [Fischerella thermalis CCMEE 5198]|jgi:glucosamine-6-phosphate deaminase|uniref:glucosamine-6-phosphate deaminase n=1 Tax=Fischerella thermalis TaxID=372787 RepID=UPI000C808DAA|nr:glucosamine-6-phosphate deaminase [Fischerella thermalis]PMB06100.1 glucosamine-6-phosphate deaminase [Fischerella thermalis CCMEE 5196]PMB19245.1 glucosamine-6-phosphate deaminase [Fischerella thermalis CCMEE 5198]
MPTAKKVFRVDELNVQIYRGETELAQNVAEIAQNYLRDVLQQNGKAFVLLATGNSQIKFLDALIALDGIDWQRVTCFHLDEYLGISAAHAASFRRYLRERFHNRVNLKEFHYIEGDTLEPILECDRYSKLLQAQAIDLCCLGVGENGHIAFNDPSVANFQDRYSVKLVKLDQLNQKQQVKQGHFPSLEAVPKYAFTVTIPTICSAKKILCLAPGSHKAKIVQKMLQGDISTDCPVSVLRQYSQTTLFLDEDSASLLSQSTSSHTRKS